ncbi:HdeD family acid-resistance protein [Thermoactinospora rubra]|uniref:HdeD family acid-resistance protein n=1 Tax=Thermoactinospora rubra TaxID=1088767 RepID=UPI000A11EB34|nr:HdeD family acid-resistance protein [Thermoactinospora rubra]
MELLARNWWMLLIRGIAAIIFGILAIVWPGITLLALVWLFGAYAVVDGVFAIGAAFRHSSRSKVWLLVTGVLSVLAGIIALVWPGITALVLLYVIAFWAVFTGVTEIVAGIRLRKEIENEWMLIVGGALSVILGILLVAMPASGALALVVLIGAFALVYGVALTILSFRVRKLAATA